MIAPLSRWAAVAVAVAATTAAARADSFGGIAANEKRYLVGAARICEPLTVTAGVARGLPSCAAAPADQVAALATRLPSAERGSKARLTATAKGRVVTVTAPGGAVVVTWQSPDPVASIVDLWLSPTERIIAVEYVVRRGGRELADVVAFDRGYRRGASPTDPPPTDPPPTDPPPTDPPPTAPPPTDPPPTDPNRVSPDLARVVAAARKAKGKTALKGWQIVLSIDADHPEAHYRLAALAATGKRAADAIAALERLAASKRPDAVEWLVEARFDRAFAKLVSDPRFRAAVRLDLPPATVYERLMGLGGAWEQGLMPCDRPEIKLTLKRDRSLALVVRTACQGMRDKVSFRGTWAPTATGLELRLPALDGGHDAAPCRLARDGDEDALTCAVDADLTFTALPSRR
jgi:hypothetical protein